MTTTTNKEQKNVYLKYSSTEKNWIEWVMKMWILIKSSHIFCTNVYVDVSLVIEFTFLVFERELSFKVALQGESSWVESKWVTISTPLKSLHDPPTRGPQNSGLGLQESRWLLVKGSPSPRGPKYRKDRLGLPAKGYQTILKVTLTTRAHGLKSL